MLKVFLSAILPCLSLAAPSHINKLALFPDKNAWCEAKNITQIVGHHGCRPQSIQNRACLGQCFSYRVPNTLPQSTESLVHCDSCMPAKTKWDVVALECPDNDDHPRVEKLVEKILECNCQACGKDEAQDGLLLSVFFKAEDHLPPEGPHPEAEAARHHPRQAEEATKG